MAYFKGVPCDGICLYLLMKLSHRDLILSRATHLGMVSEKNGLWWQIFHQQIERSRVFLLPVGFVAPFPVQLGLSLLPLFLKKAYQLYISPSLLFPHPICPVRVNKFFPISCSRTSKLLRNSSTFCLSAFPLSLTCLIFHCLESNHRGVETCCLPLLNYLNSSHNCQFLKNNFIYLFWILHLNIHHRKSEKFTTKKERKKKYLKFHLLENHQLLYIFMQHVYMHFIYKNVINEAYFVTHYYCPAVALFSCL